jgi:tRNA(Ile)-lysidine synthase
VHTADTLPITAAELPTLFHDLERAAALILAVSGGPDSTALMILAARWRDMLETPPDLVAVTVDHGLRKNARHEAAAVAKLARKLKIVHRILRWTGKKPKTGIQQAARAARYRLLAQAAREAHANFVLTAHTRDDQAETVLIRMARGSGLTGLAAMQRVVVLPYPTVERATMRSAIGEGPRENEAPTSRAGRGNLSLAAGDTEAQSIRLFRPFLDIPKSRLMATLKAAKLSFADDPSNRDPRFTRARLRGLMPALEAEGLTSERLALLARRLKRADSALEMATDRAEAEVIIQPAKPGTITFNAVAFARLASEIALRLLSRAITSVGDEGPVELAKLENLLDVLTGAQRSGNAYFRRSLAGAVITLRLGSILIERAPPRRIKSLTKRRGR